MANLTAPFGGIDNETVKNIALVCACNRYDGDCTKGERCQACEWNLANYCMNQEDMRFAALTQTGADIEVNSIRKTQEQAIEAENAEKFANRTYGLIKFAIIAGIAIAFLSMCRSCIG